MQEALVWHAFKHRNIVPFFCADSTTFPHPARAMVSRWMAQGSVLEYIAKNSPVAQYAVELLHDVIHGLSFLHSANIVHGDLCGRTILIDANGRACLSDFGLAFLVESGPVLISSARWNAPELSVSGPSLKPTHLSDVWAFGCVCGEIWTEGTAPFSHFLHERDIPILAFADSDNNSTVKQPYQTRPSDKQGTLMPDRLWELTQRCWRYDPSERPPVQIVVDVVTEMKGSRRSTADTFLEQGDGMPSVASALRTRDVASQSLSPSSSGA
ncbi:kinase-like domain-containing protein [Mycena albidolilacea]|uniref:Kinase-like domain-containing protein n=1 Tax=Mycena albidolilacea TaxID=1033008 RepID=A0AAD7A8N8_9AGAR|nr:kinase-like domain-containing protein [Mycena albidolilacea]